MEGGPGAGEKDREGEERIIDVLTSSKTRFLKFTCCLRHFKGVKFEHIFIVFWLLECGICCQWEIWCHSYYWSLFFFYNVFPLETFKISFYLHTHHHEIHVDFYSFIVLGAQWAFKIWKCRSFSSGKYSYIIYLMMDSFHFLYSLFLLLGTLSKSFIFPIFSVSYFPYLIFPYCLKDFLAFIFQTCLLTILFLLSYFQYPLTDSFFPDYSLF